MTIHISDEQIQRMVRLKAQGLTLKQIAARFGVSYETVRRRLAKAARDE